MASMYQADRIDEASQSKLFDLQAAPKQPVIRLSCRSGARSLQFSTDFVHVFGRKVTLGGLFNY